MARDAHSKGPLHSARVLVGLCLQKKEKEAKKAKAEADKKAKADKADDKPAPPKFGKDPVLFSVRVHVCWHIM